MHESEAGFLEQARARSLRIKRLQAGNNQFGCGGTHHGDGSPGCPKKLHHHHDEYCVLPDKSEWLEAGYTDVGPIANRSGAGGMVGDAYLTSVNGMTADVETYAYPPVMVEGHSKDWINVAVSGTVNYEHPAVVEANEYKLTKLGTPVVEANGVYVTAELAETGVEYKAVWHDTGYLTAGEGITFSDKTSADNYAKEKLINLAKNYSPTTGKVTDVEGVQYNFHQEPSGGVAASAGTHQGSGQDPWGDNGSQNCPKCGYIGSSFTEHLKTHQAEAIKSKMAEKAGAKDKPVNVKLEAVTDAVDSAVTAKIKKAQEKQLKKWAKLTEAAHSAEVQMGSFASAAEKLKSIIQSEDGNHWHVEMTKDPNGQPPFQATKVVKLDSEGNVLWEMPDDDDTAKLATDVEVTWEWSVSPDVDPGLIWGKPKGQSHLDYNPCGQCYDGELGAGHPGPHTVKPPNPKAHGYTAPYAIYDELLDVDEHWSEEKDW